MNQLNGITISVKSHRSLIAEEEGPPGGEGIKSIVNCSIVSSNEFEGTEISDADDEGLNSWENFTKEILEFLDTLPNHIRIQINTKLFDGSVPKNQESFDSGMAEFSNELHVIAIEESQIIEEWEKIYHKTENQFQIFLVVKVKKQHYRILFQQNYIQDLFIFQIIRKFMEISI